MTLYPYAIIKHYVLKVSKHLEKGLRHNAEFKDRDHKVDHTI